MPGLFEQFPHTNLHELNLDWMIDLLNQFKKELETNAVLSVNGQTGHVTLYESENVILPALPSGIDQWRLVRLMDGQYVGILFYNNHAYIQRGNSSMRLLTQEDIPTSAGVVAWNGRTGIVNVTGMDIPVDDTADSDSIEQAITNEHTERVNVDNALQNAIQTLSETKLVSDTSIISGESLANIVASKLGTGANAHGFLLFTCLGTLPTDIPSTIDGISVSGYGQGWVEVNGYYHTAYYHTPEGNVFTGLKAHNSTSFVWNALELKSSIKSVSISGITTGNGNIQLPIAYWEGIPIAVKLKRTSDNGNIYTIIGRWGSDDTQGNWGCKCYGETETNGLQKNVDVTGVLYYYKF